MYTLLVNIAGTHCWHSQYVVEVRQYDGNVKVLFTVLEPRSRCGDKPLKFQVIRPQNGTAVLKGLILFCINTNTCDTGSRQRAPIDISIFTRTINGYVPGTYQVRTYYEYYGGP